MSVTYLVINSNDYVDGYCFVRLDGVLESAKLDRPLCGIMEIDSSPAAENSPRQINQQTGAEVRSLLKGWIGGASALLRNTPYYSKLLTDARAVSLPNYDRIAYYAVLFDRSDGVHDWRQSTRLPQ